MSGAPNRRHRRAARAILALALAAACLGGVAYAATGLDQSRPAQKGGGPSQAGSAQDGPPRPSLIESPASVGVSPDAQFRFHVAPVGRRPEAPGPAPAAPSTARWRLFECRADEGEWSRCSSPHILVSLEPGLHTFAVRALNRRGQFGRAARYRWTQLEPMEFTIDPSFGSLPELMPGDPPLQLPVQIGNPNPAPIEVTSLSVTVSADRPGCEAGPNFAITPSSLTPTEPLQVPAGGSARLPRGSATAPALALRDLPFDQNACQGASLHLVFSGEARG